MPSYWSITPLLATYSKGGNSAFESEEYAIAVKKGNTELLDKINKSIEAMLADGTVAELGAQYIETISAE